MIVAGFGFRSAVTLYALQDALTRAQDSAGINAPPLMLALPQDKALHPDFRAFAAELNIKVVPVTTKQLQSIDTPTQAPRVLEKRGTGSVAEACALAVAGPQAKLITTRHISTDRMASCALAKGETS